MDIGQDLGQWEEGRSAEMLGKPMSSGSLLLTKELLSQQFKHYFLSATKLGLFLWIMLVVGQVTLHIKN